MLTPRAWLFALVLTSAAPFAASAATAAPTEAALGILIPLGPPEYEPILSAIENDHVERHGPFTYHVGRIAGVPVVANVAPMDGPVTRALSAQDMLQHYTIRALLYPGTSGAHLGPDRMRIGDIVLGAANVDFGNFFFSRDGDIVGNEFGHEKTGQTHPGTLWMAPMPLAHLACAAHAVAAQTERPSWLNPHAPRLTPDRPDIFYFGRQGTSTMWLANQPFIRKIDDVFHVIDEDGDWDSALVASMHGVAFIEVSTISDSAPALPETPRGIPVPPPGAPSANVLAQRQSDAIIVALIRRSGQALLSETGGTLRTSPWPDAYFDDPKAAASAAVPRWLRPGIACAEGRQPLERRPIHTDRIARSG
ncbi:hypothetical protein NFI95_07895 [Acetobacteraceae bacterium KSS8]|uniref:Nucleoside phosphorylase domain-containing protein n=1 Tax=Endosaccharibacter trunci TaxID=2812733 RepID=A0ABT1W7X9_9PROT|nr:hypothetical protein [Acetobacteraceae bacterium KSS8]